MKQVIYFDKLGKAAVNLPAPLSEWKEKTKKQKEKHKKS